MHGHQGGKVAWGRQVGVGMNWEIGIDMYTLICIKWITNKNLLYKKINKRKFKNSRKKKKKVFKNLSPGGGRCGGSRWRWRSLMVPSSSVTPWGFHCHYPTRLLAESNQPSSLSQAQPREVFGAKKDRPIFHTGWAWWLMRMWKANSADGLVTGVQVVSAADRFGPRPLGPVDKGALWWSRRCVMPSPPPLLSSGFQSGAGKDRTITSILIEIIEF